MLTPDQERWVAHLSDVDRVRIVPFDSTADQHVAAVKRRIHDALGTDIRVEHHGATSLGISGHDEVDVYVPVPAEHHGARIAQFRGIFGEPRSLYPERRARFVSEDTGKHIDIFVINEHHEDWQNLHQFEDYMRAHPDELKRYRVLKEQGNGLTVRDYYRRKLEFLNQILVRCRDR